MAIVVSVCRLCGGRGWLRVGAGEDAPRMLCWCRPGGGFSIWDDPLTIPILGTASSAPAGETTTEGTE